MLRTQFEEDLLNLHNQSSSFNSPNSSLVFNSIKRSRASFNSAFTPWISALTSSNSTDASFASVANSSKICSRRALSSASF